MGTFFLPQFSMSKSNVFITGSTGTLGIRVVESMADQYNITLFQGDITNKYEIESAIPGNTDAIIHLASIVPTKEVEDLPARAFNVNVGGLINLLSALEAKNIQPYLLCCSTSHVYAPKDSKIHETDDLIPHSTYGMSKLRAEQALADIYQGPFCIARVFSFYDVNQNPPFLYPSILLRLAKEDLEAPFILPGADSVRDFLTASEVAKILLHLLDCGTEGVINVASGCGIKIRDFVQSLSPIKLDIRNQGSPNAIVADISRLEALL